MTAEVLEIRKKLDYNVSKLPVSGLKRVYEYSQMVLAWMRQTQEKQEQKQYPDTHKKVLYNGKWLTEDTVKLMTWHKPTTDTDEEVEEKIWEYLQEKYK